MKRSSNWIVGMQTPYDTSLPQIMVSYKETLKAAKRCCEVDKRNVKGSLFRKPGSKNRTIVGASSPYDSSCPLNLTYLPT
jgi:hypothetical protein